MSEIEIIECTDPTELYRHHRDEEHAQPVYISLDLRHRALEAGYDPETGSTLMAEALGFIRRWGVGLLTADAANEAMETIRPAAARMCADWEKQWNGSDMAAVLGPDAEAAEAEIDALLEAYRDPDGDGGPRFIQEWMDTAIITGDEVDDYGITADTTDTRLEEIAAEILAELTEAGPGGPAISPDLLPHLTELRDQLAEEDPLTEAELHSGREALGLTGNHLARLVQVNPRTLRSWEQGRDPIPARIRPAMAALAAATDQAVSLLVASAPGVVVTYRDDEEYAAHGRPLDMTGGYRWSAAWHRQVAYRAGRFTGTRITYPDRGDE